MLPGQQPPDGIDLIDNEVKKKRARVASASSPYALAGKKNILAPVKSVRPYRERSKSCIALSGAP
jgi:hypothetical protein